MLVDETWAGGHDTSEEESKMLKAGSRILTIWSGINFLLAATILASVVIFHANSPLLVMVFDRSEIGGLDARVIASLNALTILYNSCSVVVSVLVWLLIRKSLIAGQVWAFWALVFATGLIEVMAFIASAPLGNARWQVNVLQSVLCVAGLGLSGYALLKFEPVSSARRDPDGTWPAAASVTIRSRPCGASEADRSDV